MSQVAKIHRTNEQSTTQQHSNDAKIPPSEGEEVNLSSPNLQLEVETLETQLRELNQRYLYLSAELENFKKRAHIDRTQTQKFGWEPLAQDLLEVIDNLERSLKHISDQTNRGLADGLLLTLSQFKAVLEKQGVIPVSTTGRLFDPHIHEAVGQIQSDLARGTILIEERKGYLMHGRLLRPAQVVISSGPEGKSLDESNQEV